MEHLSVHRRRAAVRTIAALSLALLAVLPPAPVSAAEPSMELDGLARVPSKRFDFVYVRPGASLAIYKRVRLDALEVTFDNNWNPNRDTLDLSRRLSNADVEVIKADIAAEFRTIVREELGAGGYVLADDSGEDVLRVTAKIMDLYVNAPVKPIAGRSRVYVASAGRMTLVTELRDSLTGQALARIVDREQGSMRGRLEISSSMSNSAETYRIISNSARELRKWLDEGSAKPAGN